MSNATLEEVLASQRMLHHVVWWECHSTVRTYIWSFLHKKTASRADCITSLGPEEKGQILHSLLIICGCPLADTASCEAHNCSLSPSLI
jgi:hypothetical protein